MSDRQILAEVGTSLCLAAFAPWTVATLVPAAVLGAFLLDLRSRCDRRLVQRAIDRALKDLTDAPDLTDTDLRTAAAWLKHRKT